MLRGENALVLNRTVIGRLWMCRKWTRGWTVRAGGRLCAWVYGQSHWSQRPECRCGSFGRVRLSMTRPALTAAFSNDNNNVYTGGEGLHSTSGMPSHKDHTNTTPPIVRWWLGLGVLGVAMCGRLGEACPSGQAEQGPCDACIGVFRHQRLPQDFPFGQSREEGAYHAWSRGVGPRSSR